MTSTESRTILQICRELCSVLASKIFPSGRNATLVFPLIFRPSVLSATVFASTGIPGVPATLALKEMLADPELARRAPFAMRSKRCFPVLGVKVHSNVVAISSPSRNHLTPKSLLFSESGTDTLAVIGSNAATDAVIPSIEQSMGVPALLIIVRVLGISGYLSRSRSMIPSVVFPPTMRTTSAHPATEVLPL